MSRNRIELTGKVAAVPEIRTTPNGTPVLRLEVDCGRGQDMLRLGVVMAGAAAREVGTRLRAGATVKVVGTLRAKRTSAGSPVAARGVEVVASDIAEDAVAPCK